MFLKVALIIFIVLVVLLFAVLSSRTKIKKLYKKYLTAGNSKGLTGKQLAFICIDKLDLPNLRIAVSDKDMVDAYSPKTQTLIMSNSVSNYPSITSMAVVAHELGHAVQHKQNNRLFGLVQILSRITRFGNKFILPSLFVGLFAYAISHFGFTASNIGQIGVVLMYTSLGLFITHVMVKFSTIPLEYDASKKALKFLKDYQLLNKNEIKHAKKLLSVAALTYISSLFDGILIFSYKLSNFFYKKHK